MYAHPSFVRDQADSLSKLRKLTSTSNRRRAREVPMASKATTVKLSARRSVSPSPTLMLAAAQAHYHAPATMASCMPPSTMMIHKPIPSYASPRHTSVFAPLHNVPPSPDASASVASTASEDTSPTKKDGEVGRGRLDLLALAMEQATAMQ